MLKTSSTTRLSCRKNFPARSATTWCHASLSFRACTAHAFGSILLSMSDDFAEIAASLAAIAKGFHARGWLLGTSGNLSAVVQRDPLRLAMSPSGIDKGELTAAQVLTIDEDARVTSDHAVKPSDESLLHIRIVKERGAGAVLHTHSVWNTMLSDLYSRE